MASTEAEAAGNDPDAAAAPKKKKAPKKKAKQEPDAQPALTDEEEEPEKKPLGKLLLLVSLVVFVVFTILLAINDGQLDQAWTSALADVVAADTELASLLLGLVGTILLLLPGIAGLVVVILYFAADKADSVVKYFGYALLTYLISYLATLLVTGLVGRPTPAMVEAGDATFVPLFGSSAASISWTAGSFWANITALAASSFAFIYIFNRPKTKVVMVVALVGSLLLTGYVGLLEMASGSAWFSDVLWGGYIPFVVAWFVHKYVLFLREQEQWDEDNLVWKPFDRAYLNVLRARDLLEGNEPRRIEMKTIKVEVEGAKPDEKGKIPTEEKQVPAEEIPTDPRVCMERALELWSEVEGAAQAEPEKFERVLRTIKNWEPRVEKFLTMYDQVEADKIPKDEYLALWTFVI